MSNVIPLHVLQVLQRNPQMGRIELAKVASIPESEARFYCKLFKELSKTSGKVVKKGIVWFDLHFPEHDLATVDIALQFAKDFKPDIFILGGDALDMGTISFHNRGKPKLVEGKRLKREYKSFQKEILDALYTVLPKRCDKYWIIGNHELRVDRLIESAPQYEGFVELENNLDLANWSIIPHGQLLSLGNMNFIHGIKYNKHHASSNVMDYGCNVFSGHVHTSQSHTMSSPANSKPRQGVSVGCMCNLNPAWKRQATNAWVHQFLVFYLLDDGTFFYSTPIILNGRAVIAGKFYKCGESE